MKESPSLQEWRELYEAAAEFRKLEPWKWMQETDVFGVQNPGTGETGYCCIMGELGEMLAIAVYRGAKGLDGFLKIQKGQIQATDPDSLFIQDCLMLSFENRQFVQEDDKEIIDELGLKFRGKHTWPVFRNFRPGYFPWFLNRDEVKYLTVVLYQAINICSRMKHDWKTLQSPEKGLYLVRTAAKRNNALIWKDKWLAPEIIPEEDEKINVEIDEIKLKRLRKKLKSSTAIWEADFFYSPMPVAQGDRPFFPYSMMLMDHDTGIILYMHIAEPAHHQKEFVDKFLEFMETSGIIPLEILIRKNYVFKFLAPFASLLNIKLSKVKKLNNIDHARKEMVKFLKKNP